MYIFKKRERKRRGLRIHTVGKRKVGNPSLFPVDKHPSLCFASQTKNLKEGLIPPSGFRGLMIQLNSIQQSLAEKGRIAIDYQPR